MWLGLSGFLYVLAVSFICLPSLLGSQDFVSRVMGGSFFVFMSKISFMGFLVTGIIMLGNLYNRKVFFYYNAENNLYAFMADTIIIIFTCMILGVFVETTIKNIFERFLKNKNYKDTTDLEYEAE